MKFYESFLQFIRRCQPAECFALLEVLIRNLISNIINSGNISLKIALSPALLVLITLLIVVIAIKKLFKNLFRILKEVAKFLKRFLLVAIDEVNYYWELTKEKSVKLITFLNQAIEKMLVYIIYLFKKIFDDNIVYAYDKEQPLSNSELIVGIVTRLLIWLSVLCISILMSVLLLTTFFTTSPLWHQIARQKLQRRQASKDIALRQEDQDTERS